MPKEVVMKKESMEIALIEYNKKTWAKSAFLGFFVGLAVIVPGISGSTVAIIFKLYDQFLYALGNLFKQFKKCFAFLLPIGIGIVAGLLLGFFTVKKLLEILPFAVIGLFAGLMSGAFPAVKDELKGTTMTCGKMLLLFFGALVPVAIGVCAVVLGGRGENTSFFAEVSLWKVIVALPVGYVVGVTQIVPGLSASAILMALGWFSSLVNSVSLSYWSENPSILFVYVALGIGFLAGILSFSKLLNHLFEKVRASTYCVIVGLSVGSIVAMFFNPDVFEVYRTWAQNGVEIFDLILGVALFAVGAIGAYLLVRYQRKKDAESAPEE